ncbi:tyrosine-protein phosphatase non-receptor type 1 isoform X1 [Trachemys scripta elegans]|uniref:tyrosine-protein phosphatase non-receptor type 1 isoform X1 n=2 Tax=Trachemys scripta elegans TaxID=31138 RepID=UPI001556AB39|nr:tyrosine-protein phosphatase non-receptor type 1 isoform X1 [Trachemys scripta elegans]
MQSRQRRPREQLEPEEQGAEAAGGQARGAPTMEIEKEFHRLDQAASWALIYQDIRHEASDFPCKVAKHPRNKNRNRYRDVSPFDHSRIKLTKGDNDYINASLIKMEEAQRSYILTQGPLPNTCGHFWEMVWEQKSRGVVMLNRVMEKGSIKCAQYWPQKEEKEMLFEDTDLKLTLISEDIKSYYTVRQLELENLTAQETREILHFHYTTWPDFGVPESPASFLNFLFKVRESGSLSPEHGPIVVHCSAGIGRSGTFCLVDTCLLLMDKRKDPSSVDIKQVLLEMRKYRMGLIQTADQLRFSYLAVIEGAKFIMGDASVQEQWKELSNEDLEPPPEHTPPPPRPPKRTSEMHNGRMHEHTEFFPNHQGVEEEIRCTVSAVEEMVPDGTSVQLGTDSTSQDTELRRRTVGEHLCASPHKEEPVKSENIEEDEENMMTTWKPFLVNICMFTVLTAGAYLCYRVCFH